MWIWTYTCHIKAACCPADFAPPESEILNAPEDNPEIDANLVRLSIDLNKGGSTLRIDTGRDDFDLTDSIDKFGLWRSYTMRESYDGTEIQLIKPQ